MPRKEQVRAGPAPSRTARRVASPLETVVVLRDGSTWYRIAALDDEALERATTGFAPPTLVLRLEADRPEALARYLRRRFAERRLADDWYALGPDDLVAMRALPSDAGLGRLFGAIRVVPADERRRAPRVGPITSMELEGIRARLEIQVRKLRTAERELLLARAFGGELDEHGRRAERRVRDLEREVTDLTALVRQASSVEREAAARRRTAG